MKYFLVDKYGEEKPKEMTKKEVLNLMKNCYRNAEYALEHAERLFGNYIGLRNYSIEIKA